MPRSCGRRRKEGYGEAADADVRPRVLLRLRRGRVSNAQTHTNRQPRTAFKRERFNLRDGGALRSHAGEGALTRRSGWRRRRIKAGGDGFEVPISADTLHQTWRRGWPEDHYPPPVMMAAELPGGLRRLPPRDAISWRVLPPLFPSVSVQDQIDTEGKKKKKKRNTLTCVSRTAGKSCTAKTELLRSRRERKQRTNARGTTHG